MTTLVPLVTSAPGNYNPNMAETFSWVPVPNAERPLYAKVVYPVSEQLTTIITLLSALVNKP